MKKILDIMFKNKKLAFWLPIAFAMLVYLLFVLFGTSEDKTDLLCVTPIVTVVWLFGVFLVVLIQVKNPRCPEWFLNLVEFIAVLLFVVFGLVEAISFVLRGFQDFSPAICAGIITYSSVSWAHSKRTQ